jgi:hypothetical protein
MNPQPGHVDPCHSRNISQIEHLLSLSTRHVSEVTAIASECGNSANVIVPRNWLRKRVIALHSEFISEHPKQGKQNGK